MKLKEVCTETGLSRKTIRLYEEKGLLIPHMEHRNGRDYREYTPEDIRKLKTIALLRRAWFTMDEIKQMMDDPDTIQDIFPQYIEWLENQKKELDGLLSVAKTVNPRYIANVEQLSGAMSSAAAKMPLPSYDVKPRFKYLDDIEERPTLRPPADPLDKVMTGDKAKNQAAVALSRDKKDDLLVKVNLMNETSAMLHQEESGPVPDRETEQDPWWLRIISGILSILFAISLLNFINVFIHFTVFVEDLLFFAICFILRGALFLWKHQREQNAWLERMGYPRTKRNLGDLDIKLLRKIVICALILLLIIAGIILYIKAARASLEPDFSLCFISETEPREHTKDILEAAIGYVVDDVNGDGIVKIEIDFIRKAESYGPNDYHLILLDRKFWNKLNKEYYVDLPENIDTVAIEMYNMTGAPFLSLSGKGGNIYAAIPSSLSETQQSAVIEVMLTLKEIDFPHNLFRVTY